MLRKEQAILDRKQLDAIIGQAEICHLACCQDGKPYLVPLSFGYDGERIYFHSAKKGTKIEILVQNPNVSLAFEGEVDLVRDPEQACEWSFNYTSVVVKGRAHQLSETGDKHYALNQIMIHYSGRSWEMPETELARTSVWSVEIQEITGKRSPAS